MSMEKDASYFLACFDPESKSIYFSEFIREKIISKEDFLLPQELEEKVNKLLEKCEEEWQTIKKLSKLEDMDYLSDRSKKYLRRPIPSRFLFPERLELNNFNSCYPLPAVFQQYGMVNLNITIHDTVCKVPEEDRFIQKKVGFYYV